MSGQAAGRGNRGPFWMPGMSLNEPWSALAETNVGRLLVPCKRNADYAATVVERWRLLAAQRDGMIDLVHFCVGAAVIEPSGAILTGWGIQPDPFAPPHWPSIARLREPAHCGGCRIARWAGCWVASDGSGCSVCMPERELDNPRYWPPEPSAPPPEPKKKRGKQT